MAGRTPYRCLKSQMPKHKQSLRQGRRLKAVQHKPRNHQARVGRQGRKKRSPRIDIQEVTNLGIDYLKNILLDAHQNLPFYKEVDLRRDAQRLEQRAKREGLGFLTKVLPKLHSQFLEYIETGHSMTCAFKLDAHGLPIFLGTLFHAAVERKGLYRIKAMDFLYSFCVAYKKLRGEYDTETLLKQYEEFCTVDACLPDVDETSQVLKLARFYCRQFIRDIDINDRSCIPRPGPGATNQPVEKHMRYEPHVLFHTIDKVLPYDEWFYPHMWDVVEQSRDFLAMSKQEEPWSRFKFVPKQVGKARGICIEHNEVQFLQQAFSALLRKHIEQKIPTIKLRDQGLNAKLALESSKTGQYATIDMSEASDRIPRSLVSYLFQDNADLLSCLLALSTRNIESPTETGWPSLVGVKKFAPMGSALCFPIMTLVHYFLIRAIIMRSRFKESPQDTTDVYVYGDDIIVRSKFFDDVCDNLPLYGMKINKSKSYCWSSFRESCGTHAYHGVDITPVYVKHTPIHASFESLLSCIANERDLFKKGFAKTAMFLRTEIAKQASRLGLFVLPHVTASSGVLGFIREKVEVRPSQNDIYSGRIKRRWVWDLQCYQYRVPTLCKRMATTLINKGSSALMRWYGERSRDSHKTQDASSDLDIRWRWVTGIGWQPM